MKIITGYDFEGLLNYSENILGVPKELIFEQGCIRFVDNIELDRSETFLILCGVTENGAFGMGIARLLINLGKNVVVYIVDMMNESENIFENNKNILKKMKADIRYISTLEDLEKFSEKLNTINTVIDAITGIKHIRFEGPTEYIIELVNNSGKYVISVDLPSGMDYDTGNCQTTCIIPNKVVTFEYMKKGLKKLELIQGYEIVVEKIGIPKKAKQKILSEE